MRPPVEFGVMLPDYCGDPWRGEYPTAEELMNYCREVERLGFSSIWHLEHVVPDPPTVPSTWYEPFVTLATVSTALKKAKIGTSILVLPLRNPAIVAKQAATLDILSKGRLVLGVGVGWLAKEFELVGVSLSERSGRLLEMIKIMKLLWTEKSASWNGRYWKFKDINLEPKPIQKPHPPIMIGAGGQSAADPDKMSRLLRRAAELGDGWIAATYVSVDDLRKSIEILKKHLAELKKDEEKFHLIAHKQAYLLKGDEAKARRDISRVLSTPFEDAKKNYIIGDKKDIERRIDEHVQTGIKQFNVIPLNKDLELLEYIAAEIMPKYTP